MSDIRPQRVLLEVIACTVEDAHNAEAGGADRLEIVQDLEQDGLTPSLDTVAAIRSAVSLPLHVMIRPRNAFAGFTAREIDLMREEIAAFQKIGIDGVVVGFLTEDAKVDFETMERVLEGGGKLSVTFHRAFDRVNDQRRALKELIEYGRVNRILTSGGASGAWEGREMLAELVHLSKERLAVTAARGVSAENLPFLAHTAGVREFHVGRAVRTPASHDGKVDAKKVSTLADLARTIMI